jgi:hypothetical protein
VSNHGRLTVPITIPKFSAWYIQHVRTCQGKKAESSLPPATPARLSAGAKKPTKKRKSAEDPSTSSGSSCHMCPKTYKNAPMLKLHYVRAHFYAALRDKYVADLELSLPSEGGGMLTCQYCPFR